MLDQLRSSLLFAGVILLTLLALASSAQAATIPVTTTADTSAVQCTLRNAILAANTNAPSGACTAGAGSADIIDLSTQTGNIPLATPLPMIIAPVSIQGPGAGTLRVDGSNSVAIFSFGSFPGSSAISGLTVAKGSCVVGCGIHNDGTLTLNDVTVSNNTAAVTGGTDAFPEAGGIYNTGTLTLTLSTVSSNAATASGASNQNSPQGGGIYNANGATLTIDRSTVRANVASATAGVGGTTNARGGGIANFGVLNILRSTMNGNSVIGSASSTSNSAGGGAIANANAGTVDVTIDRSTISENTATTGSPTAASSTAGGFNVFGTAFNVTSSTITANSAATAANVDFTPTANVKNTVISNPLGGGPNCDGAGTSLGFNLTDTTGCGFTQGSDQLNTNPMFDPGGLTNNGGPTQTIALLGASPAIDKGLSSAGETVDQLGLPRPNDFGALANALGGDGSDIGSFELQDTTPPDTAITSGPADGSAISNPSPGFGFSATEPGSTFECNVDNAGFASRSSPFAASSLADGQHTFAVRALDAAHNPDPSPDSRACAVDTTAPETTLVKAPKRKIKSKRKKVKVSISFSSEAGAQFECKLDTADFSPCSSPQSYKLKRGKHQFQVRASDALANQDSSPAQAGFKIVKKRRK